MRFFARRTTAQRLVARAGRSDFEAWLRKLRRLSGVVGEPAWRFAAG